MAEFKKVKNKRNVRKRKQSESDDEIGEDAEETSQTLEELKSAQKLRRRQHGISLEELSVVEPQVKEKKTAADPLKVHTGGYVDMKALKRGEISDDLKEQIGTAFASETNRRDEDTEMLKYVEEELVKRKGLQKEEEKTERQISAEDKLYELPDHLKKILPAKKKKKEELLSNQMLSGIPEVDLGIEAKIKNIEATEEARQKIIEEKKNKKGSGISDFVPTNYAVNFVQHNRYNINDDHSKERQKERHFIPTPAPLRVGDVERQPTEKIMPRVANTEKATDDFHYEKFRKQMRKY